MKTREVHDSLITATDNLNGFTDTIKNVFPASKTHICDTPNTQCLSICGIEKQKGVYTLLEVVYI
uniref:hypothetical protein n=1 Tax=Tenacibaculum sediminilitoris TaxID=1820334 RepID=UPI0038B52CD8